jgi:hypothetical protein
LCRRSDAFHLRASVAENQFATAEEAKALLEKAVVAVKDDKGDQNLNAGN